MDNRGRLTPEEQVIVRKQNEQILANAEAYHRQKFIDTTRYCKDETRMTEDYTDWLSIDWIIK